MSQTELAINFESISKSERLECLTKLQILFNYGKKVRLADFINMRCSIEVEALKQKENIALKQKGND